MDSLSLLNDSSVKIWPCTYAVCKMKSFVGEAFTVIKDYQETTVIIKEENIPTKDLIEVEGNWKILTFNMVLPFDLVGFLALVATELAKSKISIFAISAFSTDHIMVKQTQLALAIEQLKGLNCHIQYM